MFHYRANRHFSRSSARKRNYVSPSTPAKTNTGRGVLLDTSEPVQSLGRLIKDWVLLAVASITFSICLAVTFLQKIFQAVRAVGRPVHVLAALVLWAVYQQRFTVSAAVAGCVGDVVLVCFGPPDTTEIFNVTETLRLVGEWLPDLEFVIANLPNLQVLPNDNVLGFPSEYFLPDIRK